MFDPARVGAALKALVVATAVVGVIVIVYRFIFGIGAIANINDAYPWGWWVGFGVMGFVAFGGAGFTIALIVGILGLERFKVLERPAITMGLLLYLGYVLVLAVELGRPWAAPVVFISWSPTSALFEVALCATAYTVVLMIEFGHIASDHYDWKPISRAIGLIYLPAVVLGVTLSHLHQSSVGTLLTIVPLKVDPRWWSELLPAEFLVSAYSAGLSLVAIEHIIATYFLRLKPRLDLLGSLARFQIALILLFLVLRVSDLIYRDAVDAVLQFDGLSVLFWIEVFLGFLLPLTLYSVPSFRESKLALFTGAVLLSTGAILLRLNTAVFGMKVKHWQTYVPSAGEFASSLGVLAGAILVYMALVRHLPIHTEEPLEEEPWGAGDRMAEAISCCRELAGLEWARSHSSGRRYSSIWCSRSFSYISSDRRVSRWTICGSSSPANKTSPCSGRFGSARSWSSAASAAIPTAASRACRDSRARKPKPRSAAWPPTREPTSRPTRRAVSRPPCCCSGVPRVMEKRR